MKKLIIFDYDQDEIFVHNVILCMLKNVDPQHIVQVQYAGLCWFNSTNARTSLI